MGLGLAKLGYDVEYIICDRFRWDQKFPFVNTTSEILGVKDGLLIGSLAAGLLLD
jgi:hypothetical protein